jgi:hypothetical protein
MNTRFLYENQYTAIKKQFLNKMQINRLEL